MLPNVERTWQTTSAGVNDSKKIAKGPPLTPKPKALRPRKIGERYELSMFSIDGLTEEQIWDMLAREMSAEGTPIPARCDFDSEAVCDCGLELDPNWEPERHVNYLGWSDDETERESVVLKLVKLASVKMAA